MKKSNNLNNKKINNLKHPKKESKVQPVEKTVKNKPKTNDNTKLINNNKNDNKDLNNNNNNKIIYNNIYQRETKLGKGFNGTVYKVLDKKENKFYALKIIDNEANFKKEIDLMKNIKSKYVIQLKDNFYDKIN